MQVNIDETQIQQILDEKATKGVKEAFEGYAIRRVIEETISNSVIPSLLETAIVKSTSALSIDILATKLAEEIARTVTKATQFVIQETMINVILDIKKIPEYDREKREVERQKILVRLQQ